MKDLVTVEKKIFDILQKNNLDLMEKLEAAKEALRFYAEKREYENWICIGQNKERRGYIWKDNGKVARKTLKELENDE